MIIHATSVKSQPTGRPPRPNRMSWRPYFSGSSLLYGADFAKLLATSSTIMAATASTAGFTSSMMSPAFSLRKVLVAVPRGTKNVRHDAQLSRRPEE